MAGPTPPPPYRAIALREQRRVTLGRCVGRGSMAAVHRGLIEGQGVRRAVAVKLFGVVATDEQEVVLGSIAASAERAACVGHPNVARTYEFGVHEGAPFLITELVEGVSLRTLIDRLARRDRRMPLDLALFIATEIAEGLNGARLAQDPEGVQLSLAHLDLSAREALLSWMGEVKVTDFEISRARHVASGVRSLRCVALRSDSRSPEIAQGRHGDVRSDVFSLGLLLREMLIGPRFPKSATNAEVLAGARQGLVTSPCFKPNLPEELVAIVDKALELAPTKRFPHAGAMAFELRRVSLMLGVGDGRMFLRRALQTEIVEEPSEITVQSKPPTSSCGGAPPAAIASGAGGGDRFARLRGHK